MFRSYLRYGYISLLGLLSKPKPGIHIINSHYVTPHKLNKERDIQIFNEYLSFLNNFATFISLEEATTLIKENKIPKNKILISFTFDDGFEECFTVIAPLLEKYNTRGAFFINANYIESTNEYQQAYKERVNSSTKKPMTWDQVQKLHDRGHLIGSHGLDHLNFAELSSNEIKQQLSLNKHILEEKLNYKCDYFAWTYGQFKHFSQNALDLAKNYYKYIYSATNYKNYFSYSGNVINRRHQEPFWPKSHIKYFLSINKKC